MAQTDRDLASIAEARSLARRAKTAAPVLAEYSQEQIDAIVDAMAAAVTPHAEALARLAHEETGYGVVADKVEKNLFSSEKVYKFIRPTGGMGLVRAAYSAGKPAYGVGPGNAPSFIERTADVPKAVLDVVTGKTFDNGVLCSSPNSVVVDGPVVEEVRREFVKNGGYFMSTPEIDAVARVLLGPNRLPNPSLVGRPATVIAQQAGI